MSKTYQVKRIHLLASLVTTVSGLLVAISTCVSLWHDHRFSSSLPNTKQSAEQNLYQCKPLTQYNNAHALEIELKKDTRQRS